MKRIKPIALVAALPLILAGFGAAAQDKEGIVIDIQTIDCRSMLKMNNEEREFTLLYFHGFKSGKDGQMTFNGPEFAAATDAIMDYCIDNPSKSLIAAFEEKR
jgi:hypothetical protein